jgi:dTDP-4-dehydrorhamnose reductase
MNRILLLGGSGILGTEVHALLKSKNFVHVAPKSSELDIRDEGEMESYISDFNPDWVINCSAWTNVEGAEDAFETALELNESAVRILAELASKYGCRVIHISTDYVFDGTSPTPYSEESLVNPINKYGESKLLGEEALLRVLPKTGYVIRTSWLYGVSGKSFVKTMAKKALHDEPAQVVDDQEGSPTSARDLSIGILSLIASQPAPGIYNYSNSGSCTWFQLACSIYELVGASSSLVKPIHSSSLSMKAKRPKYSLLSKKKWNSAGLSEVPRWESSLESVLPEILIAIRESEKE